MRADLQTDPCTQNLNFSLAPHPSPDSLIVLICPMILPLLAILAALIGVAIAEFLLPRLAPLLRMVAAGVCLAGLACAVMALLFGLGSAPLHLPFGPPGIAITLALDGLSEFFLLVVFIASGAALFAIRDEHLAAAPLIPLFTAGMVLTLLAGDGFTLFLGFETMSAASWLLVLSYGDPAVSVKAGRLYMTMAIVGALALLAAMAVGFGMGGDFAAWRAAPPTGARAAAFLTLIMIGAGSKAGLPPLHGWLPIAHPAAPAPVSAMMSGAMTKVALYVIVRMLFDLAGPNPPLWWGVPLLLLGALGALLGAARANFETDIKAVLAASTIENIGVIAAALGMALTARAAHLPLLSALALGAALLHVLGHGVNKTLMFLAAGIVDHEAGTRRLDRLGGLIHFMPVTACCAMAGAASLAALPPTVGFAAIWMLLQSLLTAPRLGSFVLQMLMPIVALLLAAGGALALSAMLRLIGVTFLGRPRAVRTAGAHETSLPVSLLLVGLAGLSLVLGLLPGLALRLAGPALRLLTGSDLAQRAGLLGLSSGSAFYAALPVALLLSALAAMVWLMMRRNPAAMRRARAWDCGYAAPPPYMPFGDTSTQYGAASLSEPLGRSLGVPLFDWQMSTSIPEPGETTPARFGVVWYDPVLRFLHAPVLRARDFLADRAELIQRLTIRRTLGMMVAALVVLLVIVALLEQS